MKKKNYDWQRRKYNGFFYRWELRVNENWAYLFEEDDGRIRIEYGIDSGEDAGCYDGYADSLEQAKSRCERLIDSKNFSGELILIDR